MIKTTIFKKDTVTFFDKGKGRVVVLLHGFLGAHQIWTETINNLSKSYRVIAIDLPGHGKTASYGYAHSMELMAKCVKQVLNHLRLKKYVVIGHSMGGYVGLAFADLFPDNLKGLCLFHSTSYPDGKEKKKDRLRAIHLIKSNKILYTKSAIKNLFATKNLKYLKKEILFATKIAKQTNKIAMISAMHGMKDRHNYDVILSLANFPIMMVIGANDNVLDAQQLLEQAELIRNKTILYLEHDGHFGFLESPTKTNTELRKFLRKCF